MTIRCARPLKNETTYAVTFDSIMMNTTKEGRKFLTINMSIDGVPVRPATFWVNNEIAEEIFCNAFASQFEDLYKEYKSMKEFVAAANKHKGEAFIIRYVKETWTVTSLAGEETEHSRFAPCIDLEKLIQEDPDFFCAD